MRRPTAASASATVDLPLAASPVTQTSAGQARAPGEALGERRAARARVRCALVARPRPSSCAARRRSTFARTSARTAQKKASSASPPGSPPAAR